jgi:hypothetical protein
MQRDAACNRFAHMVPRLIWKTYGPTRLSDWRVGHAGVSICPSVLVKPVNAWIVTEMQDGHSRVSD